MDVNQDLIYLSQKRTALSNPGTKLDDLYYSQLNTTVELSECTYNFGRYTVSLTSPVFGSTSQAQIPNQDFVEGVYLMLEVPAVLANQCLPLGWGFAAIDNISYILGSSNVSQLQITGQSLLQSSLFECETAEKRSELLQLGGAEQLAATAVPVRAYIKLPFPFSTVCGIKPKKPFDTSLLSNPIILNIAFKPASSFYGGSALMPSSFTKANIYLRQGVLANKDQSLKAAMSRDPQLMYSYPFIHRQQFSASFAGSTDPSAPITQTLTGIINADLVAVTIGVVNRKYLSYNGLDNPSPFCYDPIQNVKVKFNGLVMYQSDGEMYKLVDLLSCAGSGSVRTSLLNPGTINPFTSTPQNTYVLFVDFSRIRSACFDGHYQNVWRIGNNTLTVELNTSDTQVYTMFATYHYNGVVELKAGQSAIYFD